MASWIDLEGELDAWSSLGRRATFWWRDDDARQATSRLEQLISLRRNAGIPLSMAVIPENVSTSLSGRLSHLAEVTVLQHGYAHANHAPEGEKKAELGAHRPQEAIHGELLAGAQALKKHFGLRFLPVLVPPWNRIDPDLVGTLAGLGYSGLSTWGPRDITQVHSLVRTNTHVDIIDWSGTRDFVGEEAALDQAIAHLRARRSGEADPEEPTGLLTHHLVHTRKSWTFLDDLFRHTKKHPAVRWLAAHQLFPRPALV